MTGQDSKPEQITEEFLQLWQEQLRLLMSDPASTALMISALQRWSSLMQNNPFGSPAAASSSGEMHGQPFDINTFFPQGQSFARAWGATPDADDGERTELLARIARCEERISELESALAAARSGDDAPSEAA